MIVTVRDRRFEANSTYDEKDYVKAAGFRWDPAIRVWWTDNPAAAAKLPCDELATAKIVSANAQNTAALEASHATSADVEIPAPEGMVYRPFQKAGIVYAMDRPNVLIGDEPGLGKTIQAIGVFNASKATTMLVICPASLKINWQRELSYWLTKPVTVGIANGAWPETDIVIMNYDVLNKFKSQTARTWDILVVDECHYAKNPKALRTKAVMEIQATKRIFMTGTPIVNRPIELWPILKSAGIMTNWKYYVTRYCAGHETRWGWDVSGASNLGELQNKLRTEFMVRRLKSEVLKELPAKIRQIVELSVPSALNAEREWEAKRDETLARLQAAVIFADENEYADAVEALANAEQIAFTEMARVRHDTAVEKIPQVIEFLENALDESGAVVVFAHHHDVVDGIKAAFPNSVVLTGRENQIQRQQAVDHFQANGGLFIGSITAAGVGLTLTKASRVVFAELDWVPGNITQAEDRCHRIGQTDSVLVQHLVVDESIDAKMAKTLVKKQNVIDKALDKAVEPVIVEPIVIEPARVKAIIEQVPAEVLTPEEIAKIHEQVRYLSNRCDGAQSIDGQGFNKLDAQFGHSLAGQERLSQKQATFAKKMLRKYRRQLEN